ncbi:MAG TPA: hypothetical protein VGE43_19260 [Acidimicrobiales bacterium]
MVSPEVVWLCIALAAVIVAARSKTSKQIVGGILQRDRKGRLTLVLTPVKRKRRGGRRGRRRR